MDQMTQVEWDIENILLEFAALYNDVTTSDLQGIAMVKAKEIVKLIKGAQ